MGNCLKRAEEPRMNQVAQDNKPAKQLEEKGLSLVMKCWKETHNNLFNFNLPDAQLNSQVINIMLKKVRIVKLGDQYQALLPNDPQFAKVMPPVMIDVTQLREKDKFGEKKFTFHINEFPKISKPFWLVVKSLPNQRYYLKQGDIFKMGKVKLRVKQIIHKTSQTRDMNKQIQRAEYKIYTCEGNQCVGQRYDPELKCRICMEEGEHNNPLLAVCDCIGTSKYAHYKCLRQWFTTQLDPVKINQVTQIHWKTLECELCKLKLPYSIHLDNQTYYLVEFPKFKKPYLVLNPVYKNNNQKSKIYYFISFKKRNRMVVGRKSDADIQLCTDATISRHHTVIQYVQKNPNLQGRFYLQDNGSKFGTVVLLNTKHSFSVDPRLNGVQFQVGGDLIRISYKTQNFLNILTTNQDEVDFNNTDNQGNFVDFAQDDDQHIEQTLSEENQKRQSTKEYNNKMISSLEEEHSITNEHLMGGMNTGSNFK